jgi:hypothetical protein
MVKKMIIIIGIIIVILAAAFVWGYQHIINNKTTYYYNSTEEALQNPLMGFAPSADYIEAVGDNMLVYVDITWREWEPEEGVFNITKVTEENYLERWRSLGKRVVLRFLCDVPGEKSHMDIPDWLYEKTGDGTSYDTEYGKGYSPNYNNLEFIRAHESAIQALGDAFGQDSFVCYVELGSLGHWGEWHVKYDEGIKRFPSEEVCLEYIKPYLEAFPKAKLLMRRPFESVTKYEMGIYNDMTGDQQSTFEWLDWIEHGGVYEEPEKPQKLLAYPRIWEKNPIGGEFTSGISMEDMLVTNIDKTKDLLQKSHMTFIGPKCPIASEEALLYPEGTAAVLRNIGYRYGIRQCKVTKNNWSGKVNLKLLFENKGTAPMYFDWPIYLYLLDDNMDIVAKLPVNLKLSELSQSERLECSISYDVDDYGNLDGMVGIGIEDPETELPAVELDMDCEKENKIAILYH